MATTAVKTTTHYQITSDTVEKDKNKCYLVGPRKLPSFPTVRKEMFLDKNAP